MDVSRKVCMATVHGIYCPERAQAMKDGTFRWDPSVGAWVLTDVPVRRVSTATKYFHPEMSTVHEGEPYAHEVCPWCQMDLAPPDATEAGF